MNISTLYSKTTKRLRSVPISLLSLLISLLMATNLHAADVSLTWEKNTELDLDGYHIYQRLLPSVEYGSSPIFSGLPSNPNAPQRTITNLLPGTTYGFIATAFDTSGNESSTSDESIVTTASSGGGGGGGGGGGSLPFADDFADGNLTGWQIIDEGTNAGPSAWAVVSGALQQQRNIHDNTLLPKLGTYAWYTNGLSWSDYHLAVQLQSTDNDALGVMVRYQDPNNYYRFSWDAQRTSRRLVKVVNGTFTLLAEEAVPYNIGQSYQLDVIAEGNTLEVRVNGAPLFGGPITDSALATGSVALYSWGNQNSIFDNVVVDAVN